MKTYDVGFWKKYFKTYDILLKVIPYRELFTRMVSFIDKQDAIVLDAGAGTGNSSCFIMPSHKIILIDNSSSALEIAKGKRLNSVIHCADLVQSWPVANESVDYILSNNVLYTIDEKDRNKFIQSCYLALKPGGKVILSNLHSNFSIFQIYYSHILKSISFIGLLSTIIELTSLLLPTIKMVWYNVQIKRLNQSGSFKFTVPGEQYNLLKSNRFNIYATEEYVYAGQAILVVGIK